MEEIIKILQDNTPTQSQESLLAVEQYNTATHKVMLPQYRENKTIYKPVLDANGDQVEINGEPQFRQHTVFVNRVPISMQKNIVALRKYFMNLRGSVLYCDDDQSALLEEVTRVRKNNKYSFKIEEIAERTMSELQSAEMWWVNDKGEIKMRVLSPEKGDLLLPIFDEFGDMKYFLRSYTVNEDTYTDVFTQTENYTFNGKNELVNSWKNVWNKIPIIYYEQEEPEWADVQNLIERYETLLSNFGDNVDYTGNPITVVKGQIQGYAAKEDSGKVLQLESDADIKYLTADGAPEAVALEMKTLKEDMYRYSHTPDMSIESLKGNAVSGVAFDRLFTDAQLSAEGKLSGTFGESMQRSVNLVSAMVRSINRSLPDDIIEIETNAYRFDDLSETIQNSVLLKGILSNETLTKLMASKYGIDPAEEWERVRVELGTAVIEDFS